MHMRRDSIMILHLYLQPLCDSVALLSQRLDHVTICLKHYHDVISDGRRVVVVPETGSPRRCGGQGDVLAGSAGTFFHWTHSRSRDDTRINGATCGCEGAEVDDDTRPSAPMLAAYGACVLTKRCNAKSYANRGRSTTTVDLIDNIGTVFMESFEP